MNDVTSHKPLITKHSSLPDPFLGDELDVLEQEFDMGVISDIIWDSSLRSGLKNQEFSIV